MEKSLFGFVSYKLCNYVLQKYTTKKLAWNYTSLIHATTTCFVWTFGTETMMLCNSGGYFLHDIYYILKNEKLNISNLLYFYHHIACLYYMRLSPLKYNWFNIIGVGELSNIPNYFVYHYLKTDPGSEKLKTWKSVQKVWYGGMRTIVAGVMTYREINHPVRFWKLLPVSPLFILGILWAGIIIKK